MGQDKKLEDVMLDREKANRGSKGGAILGYGGSGGPWDLTKHDPVEASRNRMDETKRLRKWNGKTGDINLPDEKKGKPVGTMGYGKFSKTVMGGDDDDPRWTEHGIRVGRQYISDYKKKNPQP